MEYLHLFKTKTEHDSFYNGNKYKEPWLAYTRDNTLVTGNKSYEYYRNEYLTLSALEDGEITITVPSNVNATYATSLGYSKDKSNWIPTTIDDTDQTITIQVSSGEDVYLKGKAKQWFGLDGEVGMNIAVSANFNVSGNIMSLLYDNDFKDKTTFPDESAFTFAFLFAGNIYLKNAENLILPATTLVPYCYGVMFYNCSSLTAAPALPATKLDYSCYEGMFYDCSALTTAPALPATTFAPSCYSSMFRGCTALTAAPKLPATTLAEKCYYEMFSSCTSLTTTPKLPATTLASSCYNSMFQDCTSLETAPELPAITLAESCYSGMFNGCISLTAAPQLLATTLVNSCYYRMFSGCSSL